MLKKIAYEKQLGNKLPEIAKEWHPAKNRNLTPKDVTYGSYKKVWWQCPKIKIIYTNLELLKKRI